MILKVLKLYVPTPKVTSSGESATLTTRTRRLVKLQINSTGVTADRTAEFLQELISMFRQRRSP
jgi:hypothetical protein